MRRSRKPRVVWLPPDPFNFIGSAGAAPPGIAWPSIQQVAFNFPAGGQPSTYVGKAIALVADSGLSDNAIPGATPTSPSLSDIYSSGYRLRRICGQISVCLTQINTQDTNTPANFAFTAAMQVMRVDSSGLPVDTEAAAPDLLVNAENPWIWRRTWFLTNFGSTVGIAQPMGSSNNFGGGSIREGQFVDQKTARIISNDERLFLCCQMTQLDGNAAGVLDYNVFMNVNLRVLGSLRQNLGNRRNASR